MDDGDPAPYAEALVRFEAERPRLLSVGYRLLGSMVDAEDVVQEAWIRWQGVDLGTVDSPEAFLTTVVTRLALDRLRRVRARREAYAGSWLPEPISVDPDPAAAAELADSLSMALLVVLETLSPLERAAFVLREVFGESYPEVAAILGRSEPAVRQLVHRARDRVDAGRARFEANRETHAEVVQRFLGACLDADLDGLLQVLAPDVVIISDGGGQARAPRRPVHGSERVARLLVGFRHNAPVGTQWHLETFNGAPGIVARVTGFPIAVMAVSVADGIVQTLHLVANPDKLVPLIAAGAR